MMTAPQYISSMHMAGPSDLPDFIIMWRECTEELTQNYGAELVPKSMDFFISTYNYIVADPAHGVVLFADCGDESAGVLMWGEIDSSAMPSKFGKIAVGFGTYVRKEFRRHGISNEMRSAAVDHLRKYKFDTLLGAVHVNNTPARLTLRDFDLHQLIYTLDLSKPYRGA